MWQHVPHPALLFVPLCVPQQWHAPLAAAIRMAFRLGKVVVTTSLWQGGVFLELL